MSAPALIGAAVTMSSRVAPITTMEQLSQLPEDEIVAGYLAGFRGAPDYTQRGQGYWHGYLNAMTDKGISKITPEQQQLARAFVADLKAA